MKSNKGFCVAKNGLSNLIEEMKKDFLSKGGEIFTNYKCENIENKKDFIECQFNNIVLKGKKIICAMESEALKKIKFFHNFSTLKYLKMEPLLRIYAVYPTGWFSQYTRIVTPNPIRYFLPISYDKHIAMISYTDSSDTKKFHYILKKYGEESLGKHIQNELINVFGNIPNYVYFKAHYWSRGATYWLPGNYDPIQESKKSLKPFDCDVYVVGESFSLKQAWIEGSLLQCKKLLDTYIL